MNGKSLSLASVNAFAAKARPAVWGRIWVSAQLIQHRWVVIYRESSGLCFEMPLDMKSDMKISCLALALLFLAPLASASDSIGSKKQSYSKEYNGICETPWITDFPDSDEASKIDKTLADCLSNGDESGCYQKAAIQWDAQLNLFYKALFSSQTRGERQILKNSQMEWLKHRDLELKYFTSLLKDSDGSMYPVLYSHYEMDLIRERTLQLRTTLSFLCTEI